MALTFTESSRGVEGSSRYWRGTITFDSSYPAGGEAVTAGDFGFDVEIENVICGSVEGDPTSVGYWDPSASKIGLYEENATSGISADFATTDASAVVLTVQAYGH